MKNIEEINKAALSKILAVKKIVSFNPGDTIIFRLNLISPIRRGLCHMHGKGFVNGKIVVEADLLAQIAPKK